MMPEKALVVIDMQNDYLWEQRKPKFSYDTRELVGAVNRAVKEYSGMGYEVVYVGQVFPDLPTNRLFIGFSIKGTEGARLYPGLDVVSDVYFEKNFPDCYSSKAFREHMADCREVVLCGLDECGCVGATAKGAVKAGASVLMLEDCIGRRFPEEKVKKMRRELWALGVDYTRLEDF